MIGIFKKRPDARDVAIRATILARVAAHAVTAPPRAELKKLMASWPDEERHDYAEEAHARAAIAWENLKPVRAHLTPLEREFFQADAVTLTERQQVDGSWRIESLQVLLWALGMTDEIPPYDQSVQDDLTALAPMEHLPELKKRARLRSIKDIQAERAIAELWHWRSQARDLIEAGRAPPSTLIRKTGLRTYEEIVRATARWAEDYHQIDRAIDEDFPAFGKPYRQLNGAEWTAVRSITLERHHALNWLCGYAQGHKWHETPTEPINGAAISNGKGKQKREKVKRR